MRRRTFRLTLVWGLFLLVGASGPVQAETYVGFFLGAMRTANTYVPFTVKHQYPDGLSYEKSAVPGRVDFQTNLAIGGGVRAGT